MYGGLALALQGVAAVAGLRTSAGAGWSLLVGAVIFSGTVGLLALGGPRWLGAITPVGGTLLILGFALFAWSAIR